MTGNLFSATVRLLIADDHLCISSGRAGVILLALSAVCTGPSAVHFETILLSYSVVATNQQLLILGE